MSAQDRVAACVCAETSTRNCPVHGQGDVAVRKRVSARCAICHGVQHVRKDGTFGRHHLWHGHDYRGVCPGAGQAPAEVERRQDEIRENFVNG